MADIFKFIGLILFCSGLGFIAYSVLTLRKFKNITIDVKLPQPYRTTYKFFRDRPLLCREILRVRHNVNLIENSDAYAKIFAAVVFTLYPVIFVMIFILVAAFSGVWYFTIILSLFGCIISYLEVVNRIERKAQLLKYKSVFIYESAERRYSNGGKSIDVFTQIASVSGGFIKKVCSNFASKLGLDEDDAYVYFMDCIGDQFAVAFIRTIRAYDQSGKDPCEDILNTIKLAKRHYYIEKRTHAQVGSFKKLACIVAVIILTCSKAGDAMSSTLGGSMDLSWITYISVLLVMTCYTLALFYERY